MTIKIATYNIDGLPESLDLRQLPWPLKPISWLYKAFSRTTCVTINDNKNKAANTNEISHRLSELGADIVAVQEDFNYHAELMENMPFYKACKHLGGITLDNIKWFPYPRFKADGLNIINEMGCSVVLYEYIEPWKKSYGYFHHANDKLTTKGFRHYCVSIGGVRINVFVVHMDADFYDPVKCSDVGKDVAARRSQFEQLADYINKDKHNDFPLIVMGDFNSYPKYEWDKAAL